MSLYDLELEQLHVKIEFLHGDLKERIYMQQPKGFFVPRKQDHMFVEEVFVWVEAVTQAMV